MHFMSKIPIQRWYGTKQRVVMDDIKTFIFVQMALFG